MAAANVISICFPRLHFKFRVWKTVLVFGENEENGVMAARVFSILHILKSE